MPRPLPPKLAYLARCQDGLLTRKQVLAAGVGVAELDALLRRGRWQRVLPQVYAVGPAPLDKRRWVRATYLWAGPDSVILGSAALWWQRRLPSAPTGPVEVALPTGRSGRSPVGVLVHRQLVGVENRVLFQRVQVATTAHAIATQLSVDGPELLDLALRRRWVTIDQVAAAQRSRLGARYSVRAREIVNAAGTGAHSAGERLLHSLLQAAGIVGWRANADLPVDDDFICPDVRFDALRLLIEVDGFAFHTDHRAFENDRRRQNALILSGWTVLRFTWRRLSDEPHSVIAEIRRAIDRVSVGPAEAPVGRARP